MYLQLEPVSWRQEIRDYPSINVEGRYLVARCKAAAHSDLRLSDDTKLNDLSIELGILAGKPVDARGEALKEGTIGDFRFHGEFPPFISAVVFLKPDSYSALWDQVRDGGYAGCVITIYIAPVKSEGSGWLWDVDQRLSISTVAFNFTRKPAGKPIDQAPPRRSFLAWWNPSAAADAELDASIVELLNQDVEKRRRNAWLRKISVIGRIFVYACLFGALFIFRPEADVSSKPLAQLSIGDVLAAVLWVVIALVLLNAFFRPNPRPDFQEAWGLFGLVLSIGALVLGALFLYLRA